MPAVHGPTLHQKARQKLHHPRRAPVAVLKEPSGTCCVFRESLDHRVEIAKDWNGPGQGPQPLCSHTRRIGFERPLSGLAKALRQLELWARRFSEYIVRNDTETGIYRNICSAKRCILRDEPLLRPVAGLYIKTASAAAGGSSAPNLDNQSLRSTAAARGRPRAPGRTAA